MNKTERLSQLLRWKQPSSASEKDRQERAERMVRSAIEDHGGIHQSEVRIYAKGSYANETNVRLESDVDIVVECRSCIFFDFSSSVVGPTAPSTPYRGKWTKELWRREVLAALTTRFGARELDSTGSIAILIKEVEGSRPSTDVVPSFEFHQYTSASRTAYHQGSAVFATDGHRIVNWPRQQHENGVAKNTRTMGRYKDYVRALKNAENMLSAERTITAKPSYLMECIMWNVPDDLLTVGDLDDGFKESLHWLLVRLSSGQAYESWLEPNGLKQMFSRDQKWKVVDAQQVVFHTWSHLYA